VPSFGWRYRLQPAPQARVGGDDRRRARHQAHGAFDVGLARDVGGRGIDDAQRVESHAQRVHRSHRLSRGGAQQCQRHLGQRTRRRETLTQHFAFARARHAAVPQQVQHLFVARLRRQLLDGIAADHQVTALAVDMAQRVSRPNRSRLDPLLASFLLFCWLSARYDLCCQS
jgi:hypothetical protein